MVVSHTAVGRSFREGVPLRDWPRETDGVVRSASLSDRQASYLRRLLGCPWRNRKRRDVRHLRDRLLDATELDATERVVTGWPTWVR